MIVCMSCNKILDETGQKNCPFCGSIGSVIGIPFLVFSGVPSADGQRMPSPKKWARPSDVRAKKIRKDHVPGHDFFGELPKHLRVLLYGRYGSGKSSLALKFAQALSDTWRGSTVYVCAEEGYESATMQRKLIDLEIVSDQLVLVDSIRDMWQAIRDENASNVVIDSLSRARLKIDDVANIFSRIDGILMLVAHSTKQEDYKGESGFAHDCDIVAHMDDGILRFDKNRFGGQPEQEIWKNES